MELAQWQGVVQQQLSSAEKRASSLLAEVAEAEKTLRGLLVRVDGTEMNLAAEKQRAFDDRAEWRLRVEILERGPVRDLVARARGRSGTTARLRVRA